MVASASYNCLNRIISTRRVIEINFLDKFADTPFSYCRGSFSVERECPWSHQAVSKLSEDLRSLRRREVLLIVIWVWKEELDALELRNTESIGRI